MIEESWGCVCAWDKSRVVLKVVTLRLGEPGMCGRSCRARGVVTGASCGDWAVVCKFIRSRVIVSSVRIE